ncbi:MAG: hypothetical protein C4570_05260 [Ammonifex sp.]|nr:MAG: hypothetical protein C4570_05260 [Ammonifex sp.]
MPNFKIFQDDADKARIKIYGGQNVAVNTDSTGNLGITSTGLAVTPPSGGLSITPPTGGLGITPPTAGLTITSTGLAVTPPSGGLSITPPTGGLSITPPTAGLTITSTGLAVTPPTGGLSITPPTGGLSITPPTSGLLITSTGLATALATTDVSAIRANFTDTAGSPDTTYNILGVKTWTFGLYNASTTNAPATVKLQISPDATNWIDHAGPVTINTGGVDTLVATVFLKYARVYYAAVNASSAVTLNIFFQGQT